MCTGTLRAFGGGDDCARVHYEQEKEEGVNVYECTTSMRDGGKCVRAHYEHQEEGGSFE